LALLFKAVEHGFTPVFEFTQIAQALFEFSQLNVDKPASGFLAVARTEGHRGPAVKQLHGRLDLVFMDLDFGGDLANDFLHVQ
ncbi:MAG: hypothetical protein JWP96_1173, partial [Polaromonas sp.]|nr:hypothetical protein [Polaromonas sp.]